MVQPQRSKYVHQKGRTPYYHSGLWWKLISSVSMRRDAIVCVPLNARCLLLFHRRLEGDTLAHRRRRRVPVKVRL